MKRNGYEERRSFGFPNSTLGSGDTARRWFLTSIVGSGLAIVERTTVAQEADQIRSKFDSLLDTAVSSGELDQLHGLHEYQTFFAEHATEATPIRVPPSPLKISDRASKLIMACEITSERLYTLRYQSPIWPGGDSGVTIGVGYDLGYVAGQWFQEDWANQLDLAVAKKLAQVCGAKKEAARDLLPRVSNIVVPWNRAADQFTTVMQPRYVGLTVRALPNSSLLSADALGALVSLTYNRGPGYSVRKELDPTGRYNEMREIRSLMSSKEFAKIPAQIRGMKRLWEGSPKLEGLLKRRELEATLFELGLTRA